jgi:hypothetical protein
LTTSTKLAIKVFGAVPSVCSLKYNRCRLRLGSLPAADALDGGPQRHASDGHVRVVVANQS